MRSYRNVCLFITLCLVLTALPIDTCAVTSDKSDLTIAMKTGMYTSDDTEFMNIVSKYKSETGKSVEVEFYSSDEELNTRMNTELLSGGGPDLIQGTDIPYWTFAERGVFADFAELIENDPDVCMEDYSENIIDPLKDADGHLYIMPCSFRFFYVMVNEPLFKKTGMTISKDWTLQNLLDTCIQFTGSTENPQSTYAMSWGNEWLSKAVEDELMAAINFSKGKSNFSEIDNVILEYLAEPSLISSSYDFANPMFALYDIANYLYFSQTLSLSSSQIATTMILFENDQYEVRNFPRSEYRIGEYLYDPKLAFCINKAGNSDEAWQFMKYLLSDEVQTGHMDEPLYAIENPVNKKAVEMRIALIQEEVAKQAENKKQGLPTAGRIGQSKHNPDDYMTQINRYIDIYTELRDSLRTPALSDSTLKESIISSIKPESGGSFNPSKSRNEISRIIDVYMGEEGGNLQKGYSLICLFLAVVVIAVFTGVAFSIVKRRKTAKKMPTGTHKL